MPTAKNARGIDLLVYNSTGRQHLGIQVKALSRRKPPVPLGKSIDELMRDWWIIVTNVGTPAPDCFIMKPAEVKRLAHRGEGEGRISCWMAPKAYHTNKFHGAWDRIERGDVSS